jgi:hypothetical protein
VLLPVIADQCLTDRLLRGLDTLVAQRCKGGWVALASQDGPDDAHAGRAGDVGHDVVQLQVHLHQRLLHVLEAA